MPRTIRVAKPLIGATRWNVAATSRIASEFSSARDAVSADGASIVVVGFPTGSTVTDTVHGVLESHAPFSVTATDAGGLVASAVGRPQLECPYDEGHSNRGRTPSLTSGGVGTGSMNKPARNRADRDRPLPGGEERSRPVGDQPGRRNDGTNDQPFATEVVSCCFVFLHCLACSQSATKLTRFLDDVVPRRRRPHPSGASTQRINAPTLVTGLV